MFATLNPEAPDLIPDTIAYQKRIHKNAISMSVGLTNISPC
ncbi:hypothetical protein SPIRO4BDMA_30060 [uncultured spirochete]|uniref:Uncharacterized protein n=1 Tax=uncultured spirochete TaxID=156406 RepID=A0A3P3XNE2_9SPIR|nr:hypothetical protein SPIRO4BDMA_30060 [uncultured spirochete]